MKITASRYHVLYVRAHASLLHLYVNEEFHKILDSSNKELIHCQASNVFERRR